MQQSKSAMADRMKDRKGLIISVLINAIVPYLIFTFLTNIMAFSEFNALSVIVFIPLLSTGVEIIRKRRVDFIAMFALLGALVGIVVILVGGDERLLVMRESIFTGISGLSFLISLLFPKPLMFYFIRQMATGGDKLRIQAFNNSWQTGVPRVRHTHYVITAVWGSTLFGEFLVRAVIAYTVPIQTGMLLGNILFPAMIAALISWTLVYARRIQKRIQQENASNQQYANNQPYPGNQQFASSNQSYPNNQPYPNNQQYANNQPYPNNQSYASNQPYPNNQPYRTRE